MLHGDESATLAGRREHLRRVMKVKHRFAFTPWVRAMRATDRPSTKVCSPSGHLSEVSASSMSLTYATVQMAIGVRITE